MRALTILLTLTLLGGCIKRYAAPDDPPDAPTPYSAFATMHRVTPPAGPSGAPLPSVAFRLAITDAGWLADTVLVDGPDGEVRDGAGDVADALALFDSRTEPIILLLDAAQVGSPESCELAALLGSRAVLATGPLGYGRDAAAPRTIEDASTDPLGGVSVSHACGR